MPIWLKVTKEEKLQTYTDLHLGGVETGHRGYWRLVNTTTHKGLRPDGTATPHTNRKVINKNCLPCIHVDGLCGDRTTWLLVTKSY